MSAKKIPKARLIVKSNIVNKVTGSKTVNTILTIDYDNITTAQEVATMLFVGKSHDDIDIQIHLFSE